MAESCEHGNESSGSVKRVFLDRLSGCKFLQKDSVLWS
jgi:hypothetical protein